MKEEAIISWKDNDDKTKVAAFSQLYAALEKVTMPHKAIASDVYRNIYQQDISIRDEYSRHDYDQYRPGERKPTSPKGIIQAVMSEYDNNGIVHNIIDLMGDFASQGIELNHPVKRIENLYREWFKKVDGYHVTERLANYLFRIANVIVLRETAKIPIRQEEEMYQSVSSNQEPNLQKREIPWSYSFLNPLTLDIVGEEIMPLTTLKHPMFVVNVPRTVASQFSRPSSLIQQVLTFVPQDIISRLKAGDSKIPLDPTKVRSIFYKKDDWKSWATPMVYSVLDDLHILRKMKQADLAALDGAISQIRIWKVGNLEYKIAPTAAAINKLASVLMNNMGGGIMDLIWGPDLEYKEATTNLHNFLGETKYIPTLNRIFAGLGIPPLFTGSSNQGSFTNNFIAIKTLIERLNYVRSLIKKFWDFEIKIVQKSLGFKKPATLSFDRMTLNDESSLLTLIRDLVDRNYVSVETLQEMIGVTPEIESVRLSREGKLRKRGKLPEKATPYTTLEEALKKAFVSAGMVTPSEVGLELEERIKGEKTSKEIDAKTSKAIKKDQKGIEGQGRPKSSKDKIKRKDKVVLPRKSLKGSFLHSFVIAEDIQKKISEIATEKYLKEKNKKNLRQLTSKEFDELENKKFAILCENDINSPLTDEKINELFSTCSEPPKLYQEVLNKYLSKYLEKTGNILTTERRRTAQSGVYALFNSERASNETDNADYGLPTLC